MATVRLNGPGPVRHERSRVRTGLETFGISNTSMRVYPQNT